MHIRRSWLVLVMGLAIGLAPASKADEPTPAHPDGITPLPDAKIENAVEREIRYDPALPFDPITVDVDKGIVELKGTVGSLLARERATKQAQTVKGVRSVVNELVVVPMRGRSDEAIAGDVTAALLADPAADSYEIQVRVLFGRAILEGVVDSWRERALAGTVTKGVRGVRAVDNRLAVSRADARPASEMEMEIEQALRWDVYVDDALIDVDVDKDGVVTLSGVVGSAAERALAMGKAWTRGVRRVDASALKVERWARDADLRGDKYRNVSDPAIETAVDAALRKDPRVGSFHVTPMVDAGMVTLVGMVDNLRARRSAARDARNTVGVIGVLDHLKVRPVEARSDGVILEDVRAALARDPFTHRFRIHVDVEDGVVRLTGTADTLFERGQADDLASRVTGVRDIVNRIMVVDDRIAYDPYVDTWRVYDQDPWTERRWRGAYSDLALQRRVEAKLLWSPFVDGSAVKVDADEGVVTLTGTVGSWAEWNLARQNAYEAGATFVHNRLHVSFDTGSAQ